MMAKKKANTAAEKRYMGRVAALSCITCGKDGVHVHHIRTERIKNNFLTIPLCPSCHLGEFSIHMSKQQFESVYGCELTLLAMTIEQLNA